LIFLAFAAKEKLKIAASLSEAQTAKEPGRKVFAEMLDRICAGEAGGILAWHPLCQLVPCGYPIAVF